MSRSRGRESGCTLTVGKMKKEEESRELLKIISWREEKKYKDSHKEGWDGGNLGTPMLRGTNAEVRMKTKSDLGRIGY